MKEVLKAWEKKTMIEITRTKETQRYLIIETNSEKITKYDLNQLDRMTLMNWFIVSVNMEGKVVIKLIK